MSLDHAILGFLNYRPSSGYDLKKVFDVSIRHFWPADQGQIYRTLARLAENGWVEMAKVEQEDRPDRKVYSITEAGRSELRRWISGPPPLGEARSAPLIQVFFSGQLTDEEALERFEGYAAVMREILSRYADIPAQAAAFHAEIVSPREHFFWNLTIENGVANLRANLAWAESIIERIKNHQVPQE